MRALAFAALLSLRGMVMADTDKGPEPEVIAFATVGEAIDGLENGIMTGAWECDTPLLIAIGRGRIMARVALVPKMVQPVEAAGYYVLHNDPASTPAVVLYENPKNQPSYPMTEAK